MNLFELTYFIVWVGTGICGGYLGWINFGIRGAILGVFVGCIAGFTINYFLFRLFLRIVSFLLKLEKKE